MKIKARFSAPRHFFITFTVLVLTCYSIAPGQVAGYMALTGGKTDTSNTIWDEIGAYGNLHDKFILGAKYAGGFIFMGFGYSLVYNEYINIFPAVSVGSDLKSSYTMDISFGVDLYEGHKVIQKKKGVVLGLRFGYKYPLEMLVDKYQEGPYIQLRYGSI